MDVSDTLFQNYPNPFCPVRDCVTRIEYSLSDQGTGLSNVNKQKCSVKIYNIAGELVRTLLDKNVIPGSKWFVDWDARNDDGSFVSDGVYICQLIVKDYKQIIKIIVIK
jgi:flagellar hook assembly protein FlgD